MFQGVVSKSRRSAGYAAMAVVFFAVWPAHGVDATRQVTIYRDTWGIPHIYADTLLAAAYATGYAQAEDRLTDILIHVRMATGTMSEAFGPTHVQDDYVIRLFRNPEVCREYWEVAPRHIRELGDGYMQGVKAYMAEHPEKVPEWAPDLYGWQCAAIGRAMLLNWPVGTIMDDLNNRKKDPGIGSNEWAVTPARSAEGCPILLTDPHLTWEGMALFHEARIHGGDLHMTGFFIVGTPLVAIGHNNDIGWACTTGGPDTSDVYELTLNPDNPMQYQYDVGWRDLKAVTFVIPVKGEAPVEKTALYSHYGPIMAEPDLKNHVAYAGATPYLDSARFFEQMYAMNMARNTDEFYQALAMNEYFEQNIMFAGRDGNVRYVRTGRVPVRPKGYDWNAPVPGNTSATEWQGIHPIEDLVQIKNPSQGYLQNCNISPAVMTENSPMTPDKYLDYIYNVSWDKQNNRGRRALELLGGDDSITKEDALDYALDITDVRAGIWNQALRNAVDAVGQERMKEPDFAHVVKTILGWDGKFSVESKAAPLVKAWRMKTAEDVANAVVKGALSADQQEELLKALSEAIAEFKSTYGRLDVAWGDVNVVGRDGRYFPCPGTNFRTGNDNTITLQVVGGVREVPGRKGTFYGRSGSMSIQVMFFHKEGIESYTCQVWGNSGDPASPHYLDQAEKLYTKREFKPTWWTKEALLPHVASEKTISLP